MTPAGTSPFVPAYRVLSAGIFMLIVVIAFEFMAVATALPVAAKQLGGLDLYAWALTGFLGAAMFANGIGGELCDRIGPRLPLLGGGVAFGVGLLVSGLSTSMPMLITGRVVQGLGAGLTVVAVYVVIAQCYPERARPKVMSLIATAWVVPSVVGPFVAGGLTEYVSWRWAFLSIAPLVPIPLVLVLPRVVGSARPGPGVSGRPGRTRFALAMAAGAAVLQWAGLEAEGGRWLLAATAVVGGSLLVVLGALRLFPAGTLRLRAGTPVGGRVSRRDGWRVLRLSGVRPAHAGGAPRCQPDDGGDRGGGTAVGWSVGSWWQGRSGLRTAHHPGAGRRRGDGGWCGDDGDSGHRHRRHGRSRVGRRAWAWLSAGWDGPVHVQQRGSVFRLTPVAHQGVNSAAIQMSDSLGGLLVDRRRGGCMRCSARDGATELFSLIFALAAVVLLAGIVVSTRVRSCIRSVSDWDSFWAACKVVTMLLASIVFGSRLPRRGRAMSISAGISMAMVLAPASLKR